MEIDKGWQVKSNKIKGTSSPPLSNKPHRTMILGTHAKSFKEVVSLSPSKGATLGNVSIRNRFSSLGNILILEISSLSFLGMSKG